MALSRLRITFTVDLVDTDTVTFDLGATTYLYTCVDGVRTINEFSEVAPFGTAGDSTCLSYQSSIFQDYGTADWDIDLVASNAIELTCNNETDLFSNGSSNKAVLFLISSVDVPEVKKSYYFEFVDNENVSHRVDIDYDEDNTNKEEINGTYTIQNADNDDILAPLRPLQVTCDLQANENLTFDNLYTEEERIFKVTITRDSTIIFVGWLSSDGLYENFVADKWFISLTAIDGLGYLKDISYINNDGILYSGKQTDIEKLSIALGKTDLALGFRTSINIYYDDLSTGDILNNTYFNAERYYTEDNNEPFNCNEILLSVLEKYNACITQKNGIWYIYRPNEIFDNSNVTFYNYDADGVLVVGENTITEELSFDLGSQIDSYYPHHVNGNQRKSLKRSLGTYRNNFKYGRIFPYYTNTVLNWTNLTTLPDWTIVNSNFIEPCEDLQGLKITNASSPIIIATSDTYTVSGSPKLNFKATYSNLNDVKPILGTGGAVFNCKIIYTVGANTYYLTRDGEWVTGDTLIQYGIGVGEKNFTLNVVSNELPEADGDIYIDLYDAGFDLAIYPVCVHNLILQIYTGEDVSQGQFNTIEKLVKATPNTDDIKKLIHGDVPDNSYYSAIYENDTTTNTVNWYRKDYNESKPLLRIMVEDRLRMSYNPSIIFEGDVYGYIPFLSMVNVNNVKDKMMFTEWSYDAKSNVTSIKLLELKNYAFQEINVAYSLTEDYGETTKPTIKS